MPKQTKRPDLIMQRVSFDLSKHHHVDGVIIQAFEGQPGQVDVQVKLDGSGELRWFYVREKEGKPALPNAPKTQTCEKCGRPAKRNHKGIGAATYRCSTGHVTVISIKGE